MNGKMMPFFTVFPNLILDAEIEGLMQSVTVERVTVNPAGNRLRVFMLSENWLKKAYIYRVEEAISKQIFADREVDVHIVERFHLSPSYTPELFYDSYKASMLEELKSVNPLLFQCFLRSNLTFSKDGIRASIPDTPIRAKRKEELADYIEKVFTVRAGFHDLDVVCEYVRTDAEPGERIREEDRRIAEKVRQVLRNNEDRKRPPEEEKKLPKKQESRKKYTLTKDPTLLYGRNFDGEPVPLINLTADPAPVVIRGEVYGTESRKTRTGRIIYTVTLTDYTDSIRMKLWFDEEEEPEYNAVFRKGEAFLVQGLLDFDPFDKEFMIRNVGGIKRTSPIRTVREDTAPVKRVELHCHTQMSDMDAVSPAADIIKQAYRFGMNAVAITDHGVVQAFPEAKKALGGKGGIPKDADMKIIYGMEAYLVDDMKNLVSGPLLGSIHDPLVVFSTVTTGQSPLKHSIIEIAAVKLEEGQIRDEFSTLVNPGKPIPFSMQTETGITDEMVSGKPGIAEALAQFSDFAGDLPLAAYDIDQEMNFLYAASDAYGSLGGNRTLIDIPQIARYLVPGIGRIRFKTLVKHLKVPCSDDMRAYPRAKAMAFVLRHLIHEMDAAEIRTFAQLNEKGAVSGDRIRNLRYYHAILLAANETGRRNLYTLVSESHLHYFKLRPRIPRSLLNAHREGLILGSACSAGELYQALLSGASKSEIARIAGYYDYLEIQPIANNAYMISDPKSGIAGEEDLREMNRRIVRLGEEFGKPVCATCDVHFLNPEDAIYRAIIQAGHGYREEEGGQPPLFLRTTDEMLAEFAYLGEKKAYEVVVENTNRIADRIEKISPIYPDKCPPSIPNSEKDLEEMCYRTAKEMYGDPLPEIVENRLGKELGSIIKNGYAVMYMIAQKLVEKSMQDGYLVGSRGSVGSSFAATMSHITEVNPLPPHYRCPVCRYSEFDSEETILAHKEGRCGCDMPDKRCPVCGEMLVKDGFDIPFETFLGFKGDKEPDIDLNFSGDEQGIAQAYTEVIFGKGQTFKAGTIGTVAEKTAYGYALKYFEEKNIEKRRCELERLAEGCVGVRRTTGQHPGGVIVLPKGMDINWFTPVQHPANDTSSPIITTHFDYHSIDANLLKLDILGHDDPTIIRMLKDLTGEDPMNVPLDDKDVLSLFTGTEALGIGPGDLPDIDLGTLGVPEFGTSFVMGMLRDTKPKTFSELIRISGLSHGTNVWLDNAQYFIKNGDCTLGSAICTRDDIMLNLINWGVQPEHSFKIMEAVRKGKGLTADQEKEMREHSVPDWYIESCKRIKYMFPKAHAAAYVMNAFRIAYYKIHHPLAYYAAMFSIRVKTFNYEKMCQGAAKLEYCAEEIRKNPEQSAKDAEELDDMKIVREMYARGFEFAKIDLMQADATRCRIIDGRIMPPLSSISGMGETQAKAVFQEAAKGPFLSKDDFRERTHVSKTIIDLLAELGILGDIPESNQISIFDIG